MNVVFWVWVCGVLLLACPSSEGAETFSVASYNLDNYRIKSTPRRKMRSEASRAVVAKAILTARPGIIGLQELGSRDALTRLHSELARRGLHYDHRAILEAGDREIHCGVLSQFPIVEDHSDSGPEFVLYGRAFRVLRGVMELEIRLSSEVSLTLINVHLKSKLTTWFADQADYRLAEAELVRRRIDRILARNPHTNLVVLGDFNDHPRSRVLKTMIGQGRQRLFDLRPVEASGQGGKGIAWTHYYEGVDGYFRYDFLLVAAGLKERWIPMTAEIPRFSEWELASDHRLIQASFSF